jgi:peptidoglycan/xylan/chitin deacetylase (PgdA/CDA1 family)
MESPMSLSKSARVALGTCISLIASLVMVATSALTATPAHAATTLNNDCSAGYVTFTFDDGPDVGTPTILNTLQALHVQAAFFVLGTKLDGNPANQRSLLAEAAGGHTIGNHSYDHASFTGVSTSTAPLTDAQIQSELQQTDAQVTALGLPGTTLYRPPYGDINSHDDLLARNLGYRIVMPWGQNIVDSQDWTGISPDQIVSNVTNGYTQSNGVAKPGIKANSIISMHDGDDPEWVNTNAALPGIVDYMNAHHLCATPVVRPDATGGVVPVPAPPTPDPSSNLVQNPSLERVGSTSTAPNGTTTTDGNEPVCFQQAGASPGSNNASWTMTTDAHSGSRAESVTVPIWASGDRKLVATQRASQASCLAAVTPGKTYSLWVWYKGNFPDVGAAQTKVSIATYYRTGTGTGAVWNYWQGGPLMPSTAGTFWNAAYFVTAPLPANATAMSFGLAINGVGSITTDDYFMAAN